MHAAGVNAGLSAGTFYSQGSANSTVGEHDLQLAEYQVPALASGTPAVCDALGGQVLPSRKILGKKGKVWYHKRYGIYRFKESREIRTQGDTQAGRTAQENGKNGKRNRGINRSTAESRKRNMDSVSTRGRKFSGAKKVWTKAGQPHGPYSGRTRKYPKGNRREDTGGFRDHRQAVDIGTDAAVHSEAVSQGNKRANTVGLHEALGHELPASGEACPEAESYRHLKVEKRGISRNFKACGGGECHNLLGR